MYKFKKAVAINVEVNICDKQDVFSCTNQMYTVSLWQTNNKTNNMKTKIDIRRAITERGYTITSFCQKFNLKTQNIIQNYINGNPTIKRLEDLSDKLECDITDLFYPIEESVANLDDVMDSTNKADEQMGEIKEMEKNTAMSTITFCPHCGAKVRVGVLLLSE